MTFLGLTVNVLGKHDRDCGSDDQVRGGRRVDLRIALAASSCVDADTGALSRKGENTISAKLVRHRVREEACMCAGLR